MKRIFETSKIYFIEGKSPFATSKFSKGVCKDYFMLITNTKTRPYHSVSQQSLKKETKTIYTEAYLLCNWYDMPSIVQYELLVDKTLL